MNNKFKNAEKIFFYLDLLKGMNGTEASIVSAVLNDLFEKYDDDGWVILPMDDMMEIFHFKKTTQSRIIKAMVTKGIIETRISPTLPPNRLIRLNTLKIKKLLEG